MLSDNELPDNFRTSSFHLFFAMIQRSCRCHAALKYNQISIHFLFGPVPTSFPVIPLNVHLYLSNTNARL